MRFPQFYNRYTLHEHEQHLSVLQSPSLNPNEFIFIRHEKYEHKQHVYKR